MTPFPQLLATTLVKHYLQLFLCLLHHPGYQGKKNYKTLQKVKRHSEKTEQVSEPDVAGMLELSGQ